MVMCTGSQGEPLSALSRMANGEHKTLSMHAGDTVIISATPIPGNEKGVQQVINSLAKIGCDVYDKSRTLVHVSGHGSQEELKLMLAMAKPTYFMPVHGEAVHLRAHAGLARKMGIADDHIFVLDNGESLEMRGGIVRVGQPVESGVVYVDGLRIGDTDPIVLRDRQKLANDGMVTVVATMSPKRKRIEAIEFSGRGVSFIIDDAFSSDAGASILKSIEKGSFNFTSSGYRRPAQGGARLALQLHLEPHAHAPDDHPGRHGGLGWRSVRATARQSAAARAARRLQAGTCAPTPAAPLPRQRPSPCSTRGVSRDIAGLILAVAAIASLIAVVAPASAPVTQAVSGFYHLGFGLGGYVLPFVLLGAAALVFVRDRVEVRARTAAGALIIFLSVISLLVIAMTPDSMVLGVTVSEADLARSGGYVGFAIASTIAKAFGKPITAVLLVGVIACGAVLIGFSISGFVQELRDRAERLASLRRIDLNDRPWGDDLATASSVEDAEAAFAVPDAQPRRRGRHAAVPSAFEGAPTAVADQLPTTLLEDIDDGDDDPFVDLSEQLAAESAPTVLVERGAAGVKPVDVRRARASRASSATQKEEVGEREFEPLDALPDADDGDEPPFEPTSVTEGGVATQQAIPAFLLNPKRSGGAGSADANPSGERTSDAESSDPSEPEGALAPSVAPPSREEKVSPSVPARDVKPAGSVQPETAEGERRLPPLSMLRHNPHSASAASSDKELAQTAESLQSTLSEFNLHSRVVGWISGPHGHDVQGPTRRGRAGEPHLEPRGRYRARAGSPVGAHLRAHPRHLACGHRDPQPHAPDGEPRGRAPLCAGRTARARHRPRRRGRAHRG